MNCDRFQFQEYGKAFLLNRESFTPGNYDYATGGIHWQARLNINPYFSGSLFVAGNELEGWEPAVLQHKNLSNAMPRILEKQYHITHRIPVYGKRGKGRLNQIIRFFQKTTQR